ncbi:adenosylmethionine decarboxylase [Ancylostoma caninum]|uniref:Adenosylmethionine decarboxylase n=1 Tax=Ancylostoma caninum TaxID=29170 RepID=A0A368G1G9_ANCCA|nr:adenosylmethionine decarboxylase [Ancylostoma caninum]
MGSFKQDRWYLYTYRVPQPVTKLSNRTLEILMTDLDEDVLHTFTKDASFSSVFSIQKRECFQRAGINRIVPKGTLIHEELFDPCGSSMNAFLPDSDLYATIYVKPEKEFSFASFETNHDLPGKLLATLFANDSSTKGRDAQQQLRYREVKGSIFEKVLLLKQFKGKFGLCFGVAPSKHVQLEKKSLNDVLGGTAAETKERQEQEGSKI